VRLDTGSRGVEVNGDSVVLTAFEYKVLKAGYVRIYGVDARSGSILE
jgi:hypothetical protein